ncbi:MAG: RsmB/NOP family class I SAM-dependent RNA methyltransferase, partial [Clostridia bacterium]|nr:RsmB/NOP family class I SAM-dependent RNA methyltransferase [Clostridia bacterium]
MKDLLFSRYGDNALRILDGYNAQRPVTLRVNTLKTDIKSVKDSLSTVGISFREVEWYDDALIIERVREDIIKKLEIYNSGHIYLQSLSSMIPPLLLGARGDECILDMAAAPGGKTTQIAALSSNKAQITACEKDKIRAERLRYNIAKQGARAYVMIADG